MRTHLFGVALSDANEFDAPTKLFLTYCISLHLDRSTYFNGTYLNLKGTKLLGIIQVLRNFHVFTFHFFIN